MMAKPKLPPSLAEAEAALVEADMIGVVSHWFDLAHELLQTEASHSYMQARLKALIRQGTIPTVKVIGWANDGVVDAEIALLQVAAEMIDRGEQLPATIAGYAVQHLGKPPTPRGRGRDGVNNWLRDQCIAVLVAVALEHWPHLPMTASTSPSVCSVVRAALGRRRINISTERRVEQIFYRFADLLPAHQAWRAALET